MTIIDLPPVLLPPTADPNIEDLLTNLGQYSPDEIATIMEARGVLGNPQCSERCIIAEYLKNETKAWYVSARYRDVYYRNGIGEDPAFCSVPPNVARFMDRFDNNYYPFLEIEYVRPRVKP